MYSHITVYPAGPGHWLDQEGKVYTDLEVLDLIDSVDIVIVKLGGPKEW